MFLRHAIFAPFAVLTLLAVTACKNPPAPTQTGGDLKQVAPEAMQQDIVETAMASGDFGTLVNALNTAGLVETLKGVGPYTVFAPVDAAFEKLPQTDLSGLMANPSELKDVLTYHVVPGKLMAADVAGMTSVTTVQGTELPVRVEGDTVMVGGATVQTADIDCSNGVIHVIDTVVMPQ